MHFAKELRRLIDETMPEWEDKFIAYKLLKKKLKLIAAKEQQGQVILDEEMEFASLLAQEIIKFNTFFTDKEEEFIIKLQDLKEKVLKNELSMVKIWGDLVCLHGEMVLLENYSSINCTGILKILKKHDKLRTSTEALLRLPFIQNVLRQPFFRTELLSEMIQECEGCLRVLLPLDLQGEEEYTDDHNGNIKRGTFAALRAIQHLRKGSSTYGPSSLRYHELEEENSCTTF